MEVGSLRNAKLHSATSKTAVVYVTLLDLQHFQAYSVAWCSLIVCLDKIPEIDDVSITTCYRQMQADRMNRCNIPIMQRGCMPEVF